jgi:hypothetical protein
MAKSDTMFDVWRTPNVMDNGLTQGATGSLTSSHCGSLALAARRLATGASGTVGLYVRASNKGLLWLLRWASKSPYPSNWFELTRRAMPTAVHGLPRQLGCCPAAPR